MIQTQEHSFQTPNVAKIPHPIHEGKLGTKDHIGHFGLRDLHGSLLVEPDIVAINVLILSVGVYRRPKERLLSY